ncbi:hypothetical protein [Demequina litorisediminis]|uniref:hypothetical protein n=1 Tax=Demequina litorisediminis TaxID=1849022 RepID=UPI0024E042D1|nr:hypothetical protein [Demequina litorisediminis]
MKDGEAVVPAAPRIVLCHSGEAIVAAGGETKKMTAGQAIFARASLGDVTVSADGLVVVARTPEAAENGVGADR